MKSLLTRRFAVRRLSAALAGLALFRSVRVLKAALKKHLSAASAPAAYDPTQHRWQMAIDVDKCIGCGFCIQACPYGCRFLNPKTKTAEKCSLCYHRITRGLKPACVEVCPVQARIFGDLFSSSPDDPIRKFSESGSAQSTLKPHLGTGPRVIYAGLDKEVR